MASAAADTNFRITVVITTRAGWPHMRRSVDAVLPQLGPNDGQLVVVDASGLPVPEFADQHQVVWISLPPTPSYELWRIGYGRAKAPIWAVTEDHCAPSADWLRTLIELHDELPEAAAIFGLVDNGTRDKSVDWALFAAGYLAWAPPEPARTGAPGHANLSFKAWAFDVVPPRGDQILEFRHVTALRAAGYRVVATDRTLVTHFQSAGLGPSLELFFHNGRSIAGLRRQEMDATDWLRAALPGLLAGYRTLRTLRLAGSKPDIEREVMAGTPIIGMLHLAHALGESVGYLGGPGGSGLRLH
jgi:hypothetical protein